VTSKPLPHFELDLARSCMFRFNFKSKSINFEDPEKFLTLLTQISLVIVLVFHLVFEFAHLMTTIFTNIFPNPIVYQPSHASPVPLQNSCRSHSHSHFYSPLSPFSRDLYLYSLILTMPCLTARLQCLCDCACAMFVIGERHPLTHRVVPRYVS